MQLVYYIIFTYTNTTSPTRTCLMSIWDLDGRLNILSTLKWIKCICVNEGKHGCLYESKLLPHLAFHLTISACLRFVFHSLPWSQVRKRREHHSRGKAARKVQRSVLLCIPWPLGNAYVSVYIGCTLCAQDYAVMEMIKAKPLKSYSEFSSSLFTHWIHSAFCCVNNGLLVKKALAV